MKQKWIEFRKLLSETNKKGLTVISFMNISWFVTPDLHLRWAFHMFLPRCCIHRGGMATMAGICRPSRRPG